MSRGVELLATKVAKEVMQRAGTPHYMAPEVYEGSYDQKADVWSIGVMLFQMLTQRHPFYSEGQDLEAVRLRIQRGADYVDDTWRRLPRALRACRRALEMRPEARPSAAELLRDSWFEMPRLALGGPGRLEVKQVGHPSDADALGGSRAAKIMVLDGFRRNYTRDLVDYVDCRVRLVDVQAMWPAAWVEGPDGLDPVTPSGAVSSKNLRAWQPFAAHRETSRHGGGRLHIV